MAKKLRYLVPGTRVKLTKAINWHDLHIPKGTAGKIVMQFEGGEGARIDFGNHYGKFDVWASEISVSRKSS